MGNILSIVFCAGLAASVLWAMITRSIAGDASYKRALKLFLFSFLPLLIKLVYCQASQRPSDEPIIECLEYMPIFPVVALMYGMLKLVSSLDAERNVEMMEESAAQLQVAASVLDAGWEQHGRRLGGSYRGFRVEASVERNFVTGAPGTSEYRCAIFIQAGGSRWSLKHRRVLKSPAGSSWSLRSDPTGPDGFEEAVTAMCLTENSLNVSASPSITYDPESGSLEYRDRSGDAPSPERFRRHLDLLIALSRAHYGAERPFAADEDGRRP